MREKERERVFFPRWTLRVCSSMENYSRDRLSEILRMNSLTFAQSFLIDFTKSNFFLLSYPERSKTHGRLNTKRFNRPRSTTIRFLRTDNVAKRERSSSSSLLQDLHPSFHHVFGTSGKRIIG